MKVSPGDRVISRTDLNKRKPPSLFLTLAGFWDSLVLPQITAFATWIFLWDNLRDGGWVSLKEMQKKAKEKQDKCKPQTFFSKIILCVWVVFFCLVCVGGGVHHVHVWCPWMLEEGIRSPEWWDCCEPQWGCWELNLGPLHEQELLRLGKLTNYSPPKQKRSVL